MVKKHGGDDSLPCKLVINRLLSLGKRQELDDLQMMIQTQECLQNCWQLSSSAFYLNNIVKEDEQTNRLAARLKMIGLIEKIKGRNQRIDNEIPDLVDDVEGPDLIEEPKVEVNEKILARGESSSVLIDKSEFDVIDQAYKPGFVFEKFFKKNDLDFQNLSWETKLFDIYEPEFSSATISLNMKPDASIKDKKSFGLKYSFQADSKKITMGGLDYFLSETNMLDYRVNMKSVQGDSLKTSPLMSKEKQTESISTAPLLLSKSRVIPSIKEKDSSSAPKTKVAGKKTTKKQATIQFKPVKKGLLNQGISGLEDMPASKFKPTETFFTKNFTPQAAIVRTLKKKNSVLFVQTRSNSREQGADGKGREGMRSSTQDREVFGNKKKMRIKERQEQPVVKDTTTSAVIKKKKRKAELIECQPEPSLITKLLFKSIKRKGENYQLIGSSAGGLHLKPSLNLESSYTTEDWQGRMFDSCQQKSPKYGKFTVPKSKMESGVDSTCKVKGSNMLLSLPKRSTKKAKSCTKKKPSVIPAKVSQNVLTNHQSRVINHMPEMSLRKSLEKFGGVSRYLMAKSGKREEPVIDLFSYNQTQSKAQEQKIKDFWKSRPATAEEVPYFSQRSKTTQKKTREKRGLSKGKGIHHKEPLRQIASNIVQISSMNSPAKTKHLGKNSSSLIER